MQLSKLENISEENIVFHEPNDFQLRNTNIKYKRMKIETKLPNGKISPLVLETPFLFSFGVSKRKNQETGKLNGYSIPVCLWKKDEKPNQEKKRFLRCFKKKFMKFVEIILKKIVVIMKQQVWVKYSITNILNIKIQKVKQKRRRMNRVLQFFMSNSFIQIKLKTYCQYSEPREIKVLIH